MWCAETGGGGAESGRPMVGGDGWVVLKQGKGGIRLKGIKGKKVSMKRRNEKNLAPR
jgi:hypothetical protein